MAQKSRGNEDVRAQRTRRLLQQALFDLTVEKGFAAVTATDIAARAQVNRSTFYRYYLDKYDLLNQYFDELEAQTSEASLRAEAAGKISSSERLPAGLVLLVRHVQENAEFYRVMLGRKGDQVFTYRFRQLSERRLRYVFSRINNKTIDPTSPPTKMKLSYISSATVGAIQWWLENNRPVTPEQLAIWLGRLNMTAAEMTLAS